MCSLVVLCISHNQISFLAVVVAQVLLVDLLMYTPLMAFAAYIVVVGYALGVLGRIRKLVPGSMLIPWRGNSLEMAMAGYRGRFGRLSDGARLTRYRRRGLQAGARWHPEMEERRRALPEEEGRLHGEVELLQLSARSRGNRLIGGVDRALACRGMQPRRAMATRDGGGWHALPEEEGWHAGEVKLGRSIGGVNR